MKLLPKQHQCYYDKTFFILDHLVNKCFLNTY